MFKTVYTYANAHDDGVWAVAWAKNERNDCLVTGSVDDTVRTWFWDSQMQVLKSQHRLEGHKLGVFSVDVDASGTRAVSSSVDSQIKVWDLEKGELVKDIDPGAVNTWCVAISHEAHLVAAGSNTGDVHLFRIKEGESNEKIPTLSTQGAFISSIAFSAKSQRLATAAWDGKIYIFDLTSGSLIHTIREGHVKPVRALAFSPDEQSLLTGSDDGLIKLFDVATGEHRSTFSGHASWVLSVAWSPDNQRFASGSSDKTLKVWDTVEKQCLHTFTDYEDQVWGVDWDRTGTYIAGVSDDHTIRIHECPSS